MPSTEPEVLLIDAGNTRVKGALYSRRRILPLFSLKTDEVVRKGELPHINFPNAAAASVVPQVTEIIKRVYPGALLISSRLKLPFKVSYRGELGADRIANIAGGLKYSNSFVVVSCGTATVIDVVKEREFVGGYILPGVKTMATELYKRGALLPEVRLEEFSLKPGNSTEECIKSGISLATAGAIECVKNLYPFPLFITGGLGKKVAKVIGGNFLKWLTFEGILEVWRTERGESSPP